MFETNCILACPTTEGPECEVCTRSPSKYQGRWETPILNEGDSLIYWLCFPTPTCEKNLEVCIPEVY